MYSEPTGNSLRFPSHSRCERPVARHVHPANLVLAFPTLISHGHGPNLWPGAESDFFLLIAIRISLTRLTSLTNSATDGAKRFDCPSTIPAENRCATSMTTWDGKSAQIVSKVFMVKSTFCVPCGKAFINVAIDKYAF